jgi:hypothetical protein
MFAIIGSKHKDELASKRDDLRMTATIITESLERLFAAEVERLRVFYSIEVGKDDFKEVEEWLKDRLEVPSSNMIIEKLKAMPECDIRRLRYDFIQVVKRNRRFRKSPANGKLPPIGAANPLGESEERDRGIE